MGDTLSSESRNLSLVDELKDYFLHQIGLFVQQMGLSFCFSLLNQVSVGSPCTICNQLDSPNAEHVIPKARHRGSVTKKVPD